MSNVHHAIIALALLVSIPTTFAAPQDAKPDFSGRWAVDRNVYPTGPTWTLIIEHKDPSVVVAHAFDNRRTGATTRWLRWTFTTDGEENRNTLPMGPVMTSRSKWDGRVLVTVSSVDVDGRTESETTRWALSADHGTLTISSQGVGPKGPTRGKIVYAKQ
jgi:hypothetical protein